MNRAILAILGIMAALVVAIGVVVIVLVATGGGGGSKVSVQQTVTPSGTSGPSAGELRLLGSNPITLDPALAQDAESAVYIVEIFGGLLTLDPQLRIQPDLTREIPATENGGKKVNSDGTVTYTFHLRDGLLFHDRAPVTADDVKFSLERAVDPATQSLVAEFFLGDIVGVEAKVKGQATDISGVKVIDPQTVEITIARDLPSFLYKLTYPTAYVVDRRQVESDKNWTRHPNGTGPYLLSEWRLGEQIVLKANDHYHLGVPSVKSVRFLLAGNGITLYQSGDVDVAGVGLDDLERVQDPADPLNKDYHTGNRLLLDYLGFNTNAPPFDDANVRKAFAMAIDKNQIVSAVFKNAVPPATSILMPGLPAYDANAKAPGFNVAEAKRLLDESKYHGAAGLPAVTIAEGGTGATAGPATAAIIEMWRQNLGVDVQIEQAETATYFQNINEGRYQMFVLAWIMDYPDPEDILNIHFDSQSPNNNTFYKNAQVDTLLRQALTEQDQQRRIDLYRQAQQLILNDVPWLPLFFDEYHVLIKPYVQNYVVPSSIVPSLRYITLSPQ